MLAFEGGIFLYISSYEMVSVQVGIRVCGSVCYVRGLWGNQVQLRAGDTLIWYSQDIVVYFFLQFGHACATFGTY